MPKRDPEPQPDIPEVVRQVNELTDSEPVNGEDLLESPELKRQLREAKQAEQRRSSPNSGRQS